MSTGTWHLFFKEPLVCDACPLGKMFTSATDCTCIDIPTIPIEGRLYTANDYFSATTPEQTVKIIMQFNEVITMREWAVDNSF
jgi:hypothetical protein